MPQQVGHITRLAGFIIFKKYEDFTDPVVKAYMKYFATKNADSRETETINDQVSHYKADTLIRNKFDKMFANPKFTDEDIAAISGIPQDEIAKRRAQRH